jgi:DNA-binding transcriptional ArsR family regulator
MPEIDYEMLGHVRSGRNRKQIVKRLSDGPSTTRDLADEFQTSQSSISSTLSDLREAGVVHKLNESSRVTYYGLTEQGERVSEELEA